MAQDHRRVPGTPPEEGPGVQEETGPAQSDRKQGPVEGLVQELVRRAATIGLWGFFLTEEAIRKAFAEVVPQDWVQFFIRQNEEMRRELLDRMVKEFGSWLKGADPVELGQAMLERFDFSIEIHVSGEPRSSEGGETTTGSVRLVRRRK